MAVVVVVVAAFDFEILSRLFLFFRIFFDLLTRSTRFYFDKR